MRQNKIEETVIFDKSGCCNGCGSHADNVIPSSYREELRYE